MTDEQIALARRAVACKGWRWMPGMRAVATDGMVALPLRLTDGHDWPHDLGLRLPDFQDPATLGCVLALVREAWGGKCGYMHNSGYQWLWIVRPLEGMPVVRGAGATEAEALVAALEAAP